MAKDEVLSVVEMQNLRADVELLLSGQKQLSELILAVKNMFLPKRFLLKYILDKANIDIGCEYGFNAAYRKKYEEDPPENIIDHTFQEPVAQVAMTFANKLLVDHTMRKHALDHLASAWKSGYKHWLSVFVSRLEGKACMYLLLEAPLAKTGKINTKELRKEILLLISDEQIEQVVHAASHCGKLSALYELTRWKQCHLAGKSIDRKAMLEMDFDL
jgi:hypothetical protein